MREQASRVVGGLGPSGRGQPQQNQTGGHVAETRANRTWISGLVSDLLLAIGLKPSVCKCNIYMAGTSALKGGLEALDMVLQRASLRAALAWMSLHASRAARLRRASAAMLKFTVARRLRSAIGIWGCSTRTRRRVEAGRRRVLQDVLTHGIFCWRVIARSRRLLACSVQVRT